VATDSHSRNTGSWSLKERRKASDFKKLVIAQGNIVNTAHVRDREEEEISLYDMVAIYVVLTRHSLYFFRRRRELQLLFDLLRLPLRFTLKDGSKI
jgi:hypothetical protein